MKKLLPALTIVSLLCCVAVAQPAVPKYKKLVLSDKFYAEGAYYGDFNKDGKLDVVAGPFWFEGPDFQKKHEIYPPKEYDPKGYSDNFLTYAGDFNGDGWTDVLYVPHPGQDAFWYENPAGKGGPWKKHLAMKDCGNESPMWGDINGRRPARAALQRHGLHGLCHLGPGQARRACGSSIRSPPKATTTSTATASAAATSTATAAPT